MEDTGSDVLDVSFLVVRVGAYYDLHLHILPQEPVKIGSLIKIDRTSGKSAAADWTPNFSHCTNAAPST